MARLLPDSGGGASVCSGGWRGWSQLAPPTSPSSCQFPPRALQSRSVGQVQLSPLSFEASSGRFNDETTQPVVLLHPCPHLAARITCAASVNAADMSRLACTTGFCSLCPRGTRGVRIPHSVMQERELGSTTSAQAGITHSLLQPEQQGGPASMQHGLLTCLLAIQVSIQRGISYKRLPSSLATMRR